MFVLIIITFRLLDIPLFFRLLYIIVTFREFETNILFNLQGINDNDENKLRNLSSTQLKQSTRSRLLILDLTAICSTNIVTLPRKLKLKYYNAVF